MAVDAWLVDQHQRGSLPCLRFYTWARPTLSLGYHQRQGLAAWADLPELDQVRRPTGGRAVLHQGDLTYALVMAAPQGRRSAVYRDVCQFLIAGLQFLDMPVVFGGKGSYRDNPNCFGTATAADLVAVETGGKRVGSAQLWRGGTLLQHGSILLRPQRVLFEQVFNQPVPPLTLPAGLRDLPDRILQDQLVRALTQAASDCFGADFSVEPLSQGEIEQALAEYGERVRLGL